MARLPVIRSSSKRPLMNRSRIGTLPLRSILLEELVLSGAQWLTAMSPMIATSDSVPFWVPTVLVPSFSPSLSLSSNVLPPPQLLLLDSSGPSSVLFPPCAGGEYWFRGNSFHGIPSLLLQLTGVLFSTVDRSGTGQSGSSPRVTLRLNQVRGARDEKKGGGAANSRQGGMNAQVLHSIIHSINVLRDSRTWNGLYFFPRLGGCISLFALFNQKLY